MKCPFCKAEIEDNARFCLYCMKPLTEKEKIESPKNKKKWWSIAVAGSALFLLILGGVLFVTVRQNTNSGTTTGSKVASDKGTTKTLSPDGTDEDSKLPSQSGTSAENTDGSGKGNSQSNGAAHTGSSPQSGGTSQNGSSSQSGEASQNGASSQSGGASQNDASSQSSGASQNGSSSQSGETSQNGASPQSGETPQNGASPQSGGASQNDASSQSSGTSQNGSSSQFRETSEVVYNYRLAKNGDDFYVYYDNVNGGDIVITGVQVPSTDGVYNLPSHIDGKRVVAITALAFSYAGNNAKKVILPATIRTIWANAFARCSVTDIYFTHDIYIESLPDGVTIHCPRNCQNRNLYTYSKMSASWGFRYEEWNG